jgi:hypothetical protein
MVLFLKRKKFIRAPPPLPGSSLDARRAEPEEGRGIVVAAEPQRHKRWREWGRKN